MSILSYYLIIVFISYFLFTPKTKKSVWKYSIGIPILLSTICFLIVSVESESSYETGTKFSKFVMPTLISIISLFFHFNNKMKNEGKAKFPVILLSLIIITFFLGFQQDEIKKENDKYFEKLQEKENSIENIKYSAKIMKKKLPIRTPNGLTLYDIIYNEKNNSVEYLYKNEIYEVKNFNNDEVNSFKTEWRNNLISTFNKNSKNNVDFIKGNVSTIYKLEDKFGESIFNFTISPKELVK